MDEIKKEEKIEEVKKQVNDVLDLTKIDELIKKNEIEFELDGQKYRIKKPDFKQKQEAYQKRIEKFTELLGNEKYLLEDALKKMYLKRGIDIDGMLKKTVQLQKERDGFSIKLGELIANKGSESEMEQYKLEIEKINKEIQEFSMKRTALLEFSIENQVLIYTYSYLTSVITEKLVKDGDVEKWVRVWNSLEEFQQDKEKVSNRISYYAAFIIGMDADI